jgi:hypothetical protein
MHITWSHFLRKTGFHFSGKCSKATLILLIRIPCTS